MADLPSQTLDNESHQYPTIPENRSEGSIRSFAIEFETALVHNEYHFKNDTEFYVTFSDISVTSHGEWVIVKISDIHMVKNVDGTPGDRWWSVTYGINGSGVTRGVGSPDDPPLVHDSAFVVECDS